jgi:hypothetical protein
MGLQEASRRLRGLVVVIYPCRMSARRSRQRTDWLELPPIRDCEQPSDWLALESNAHQPFQAAGRKLFPL